MALPKLPFTSYEPHSTINGAYNFTPANGGSPMMFAGDTSGMRQAIDAMPQPEMLASNAIGMMPQGDIGGAIQGFNAQDNRPAPAPVASDMSHAAPAASNPLNINQPLPPSAKQLDASGAQSAGVQEASGNAGEAPIPQRSVPGAPGAAQSAGAQASSAPLVNPQDYVRTTYTKPHWQDTNQKIVTEGGVTDPTIREGMVKAYSESARADMAKAEADKLNATHAVIQSQIDASDAAKQLDDIEQKRLARQAALQTGADEYGRIMAQKQADLETAGKREVDQFRLYRGNAGAAIGAALAAGLGAFGATLTHSPNFALDFINRSIDRDVEAQRDEINRGVASKQNDIARIRDKYNVDTGVAEKLLAISLTEQAQQLAKKQAAQAGGQAAMEKLASVDAALAQKNLERWKSIQDNVIGKAVQTAESKFIPGGTSVYVDPRLKAGAQAAGYLGQTGEGLGKAVAGTYEAQHEGMTAAQVAKQEGAGSKTNYTAQTKSAINAADAARHQLRHTAALAGINIDEKTGEAHIVDWFKFAKAQSASSAAAASMRAAIPEIIRGQTGAKPSLDEEHAKLEEFGNPLNIVNSLQENYRALQNSANVRRANTFKGDTGSASGNEKQEEE